MNIARFLACASTFLLLSVAPSFALGDPLPNDGDGASRSAPGPVIGVGVPALVAVGGYIWYRRRQRRK